MVIGFAPHYCHGTIELLDKDEAYHLVREGHLGEGQFVAGFSVDVGREAVGATYDEDKALVDGLHFLLHIFRELYAAHFLAVLVKQDDVVTLMQMAEDEIALLLLL